jgi:hypothetical protein
MIQWYYISTKKATFAIKSRNGVVIETAPIAKKSKGRYLKDVLSFYRNKFNATIKEIT